MERHVRSKLNSQIYAEACEWFVECRSGTLDDAMRRDFDCWLRKSPEHLSAYLEIAAIWNEGPSLDPAHQWDAESLVSQAAQDHDNVIPLSGPAAPAEPAGLVTRTRRVRAIAASLAMIGVALSALMGALAWTQLRAPTYTTAIGEQRSIALPDGSTVELNSRSKLKVHYSEHARAIELLAGQALFQVAKDQARPFIVTSDGTRVRAVGTQFDVYKKRSGTIVTVVEGRVAILTAAAKPDLAPRAEDPSSASGAAPAVDTPQHDRQSAGSGIFLSAGEQVTVTHTAVEEALHPDLVSALAWRRRQLVFESASLAEVAEEFNRYNERQLVVQDADLYDFHISGVFSSTDPASLIRFLRERPGVRVIETASEIKVARKNHEEVTDP